MGNVTSKKMQKKLVCLLACMICLLFAMAFGTQGAQAASKKQAVQTASKKKKVSQKKAASKKKAETKPPKLNTNTKTIMKLNEGLLTTYEEYVKYPMNAYTLKVQNKPAGAVYSWKTSDEDIAALSYQKKKGTCRVNAKAGGSAVVTCVVKKKNGKKTMLTCNIKVKNPATEVKIVSEDTEINNMQCDLSIDREYQFLANVKSKYTSDRVYWSIQDTEVAKVDEAGYVIPKNEGRTVLTAVVAPEGYDPDTDKDYDAIYAIVIDVVEPMEEVTNVTTMTTGEVIIQFSAPIAKGSLFDTTGALQNVSFGSTSGSGGTGKLTGYLSNDGLQLYLVSENAPHGNYKLKIADVMAQNGHFVKTYEDTITIENGMINTVGANFVSIERTSLMVITATFDKAIVRPGTLIVYDNKLAANEIRGTVAANSYKVQYTLTSEMVALTGSREIELFGYAASGDSSEEGEEKSWPMTFNFDFKVADEEKEVLDTSDQPLPGPSRITQATETNNIVYIMFENRVDEESARKKENYAIEGQPQITGVEVVENSDKGCMVALSIKESTIPEIGTYEFKISGIKGYDNSYLPMEAFVKKIQLNDNKPAAYKGNSFERTKDGGKITLEFTEDVDLGSSASYFNLVATWVGKDENGVTRNNQMTIYDYEVKASGSDNRVVITFYTDDPLIVGTKIQVEPINYGGLSGTYLVDKGGNVVQFGSAEVQVSY